MKKTSCLKCAFCKVEPDPDPFDSFCDDDVRIRCTKTSNQTGTMTEYGYKVGVPFVTVGCRPYHIERESTIPEWCPLNQ